MATVALRGHRQGAHETAVKRVVRYVTPPQQVASILQTSLPGHNHGFPASTVSDLAVSFASLPDSEALQGLVLTTRDGAARNEVTTHRLTSSLTGAQILDQADDRSPEDHYKDIYAIYRSFQDGTLAGPESMFKVSTFVVFRAYTKIAERLLIMRLLWDRWKHPMDLLKYGWIYLECPLPWTVNVYHLEAAIKLETCGVPRPERSPGGFFRYSVTQGDFRKWVDAFDSSYLKLEEALLDESKTACKDPPSSGDMISASVQMTVLNGLLQSGFMERLFEDWGFSHWISRECESRKYHPCATSEVCHHQAPRAPDQTTTRTIVISGSRADDSVVSAECQMSVDSEGSSTGDAAESSRLNDPQESDPYATPSTSQSNPVCEKSVTEPSTSLDDDSATESLVIDEFSGSSEAKELDTLAISLTSANDNLDYPSNDEVPKLNGMDVTDDSAAPSSKTFQATVSPEDVRTPEESAAAHLGRHLKALVSPLSSSRSLVVQLLNMKRPVLPEVHHISVPGSNPTLSFPVPDDERKAFIDRVVELIPESESKRGWSRKRTARDWLFRRLLDTPVSGTSAAEMGYTPVDPNKDGGGVDAMPRVHPEAATMGLACMFFARPGSEVAIRSDDEPTAAEEATPTSEDQDTRRALERIFSVGHFFLSLACTKRCRHRETNLLTHPLTTDTRTRHRPPRRPQVLLVLLAPPPVVEQVRPRRQHQRPLERPDHAPLVVLESAFRGKSCHGGRSSSAMSELPPLWQQRDRAAVDPARRGHGRACGVPAGASRRASGDAPERG
ncbi:hypothetical protein OH76DRAFT_1404680 [Lentinus brumalis]|uniref:Uncharacterized protein n=1 Tax=Lentinus brumalis TaxID=2498619 RepID=A0A371D867_9APHY|nr:hypothetical protein OH76DRAFT_1404680 [Polyporus brumalis]